MTATNRQRVGELVRWIARLWSFPLIALTFLLAVKVFIPVPLDIARNPFLGVLSSLYAMALAVAFVVAWHWERVGGWIALGSAVAFTVWFTIRLGHPALSLFDLLLWLPAILFLLSSSLHGAISKLETPAPNVEGGQTQPTKPRRFFALPRTEPGLVVFADWDRLLPVHAAVLDASRQSRPRPQHLLFRPDQCRLPDRSLWLADCRHDPGVGGHHLETRAVGSARPVAAARALRSALGASCLVWRKRLIGETSQTPNDKHQRWETAAAGAGIGSKLNGWLPSAECCGWMW